MTLLAIELNDAGIVIATESRVNDPQPGIAHFDDKTIASGESAQKVARLMPHQVDDAFWHQLSLDPMSRTTAVASTPADLAHAQLLELFAPFKGSVDRAVISVPASFSPKQLGLLLGICQRAQIPVTGLTDSAVAAVSHPVPGRRMLHVDATNHSVIITELLVNKGLHRGEVIRIDNVGLLDFSKRWARTIGDLFVKQTRFDPLHSAQSEQHLYNQLPGLRSKWLAGESTATVSSEDSQHSASVDVAELISSVAGLYQPMVNAIHQQTEAGTVTTVLLSHRVSELPGFEALVTDHPDVRVVNLDGQAVVRSILQNGAIFENQEGQFSLTKSKPWQETPSVVPDAQPTQHDAKGRDLATHILIGNSIYALGDEPFLIGTEPVGSQSAFQVTGVVKGISRRHCSLSRQSGQIVLEDMSTYGTKVNGKKVAATQPLKLGDRISLGNPGIEFRLVREAQDHG